jgi:FkbM family methyltransferase
LLIIINMDALLTNKKIDIVDFDGLKLFMFKNDNLYNNFIPRQRKNQSLDKYFKSVSKDHKYPPSLISYDNCEENDNPRNGLFIYFKHLIDHNIDFTVFDIGSHVGDFAIKCGHFFRDASKKRKVISFDPSPAGMLVPFNIAINGLQEYNKHEKLAVTEYDGYYIFNFTEGNSDSSKLSFSKEAKFWEKIKFYWGSSLWFKVTTAFRLLTSFFKIRKKTFDIIVQGISFQNYLNKNGINNNLFLKIDVEGYDEILVKSIVPLKENRLISFITELHVDADSLTFLNELSEHFYIFDLFYCPNPTRFKHIKPQDFVSFIGQDLKNRKFGYTDLFLLDKKTPEVDRLINKLSSLKETKGEMVL